MVPTTQRPVFFLGRIAFVALMLVLTALFVVLGLWQMNRLAEKQAAIANIEARVGNAPVPLPLAGDWADIDIADWDYRAVEVRGTFAHDETVLVFTSLSEPRGRHGGPGYWVMTPLELAQGGTVFVNRGFVPQDDALLMADRAEPREVTLEGIARAGATADLFTPEPDLENRVEWVRDIDRLAGFLDEPPQNLAPLYIDRAAGEPGTLPQGGETRLDLSNRHLGYIYTWFGLAVLTPVLLVFWWRRGGI